MSVAPQHVGDVAGIKNARASLSDATLAGNLTEVELQAKGKIEHACVSRKGYVPYNKNKVNQDRFLLKYAVADDPHVSMFGVMDG